MRLSRQTEIAINILTACAKAKGGRLQTTQLAQEAGATKDHAAQVISMLTRQGYLHALRCRKGGICLAADPHILTLEHILRITQPDLLKGMRVDNPGAVVLGPIVEAAFAPFVRAMEQITIADLLKPSDSFHTHCFNCRLVDRLPHPLNDDSQPPPQSAYRG